MEKIKSFNFWYNISDNVINGSVFCFLAFLLVFIWNPSTVGFQALVSVLDVGCIAWAAYRLLQEPAAEEKVRDLDKQYWNMQNEYEQSIMFPGRANRPGSKLR